MSKLALQLIVEAKRTQAKKLDLGRTGLREIPEELFELVWLEELVLSDKYYDEKQEIIYSQNEGAENKLAKIPGNIIKLRGLKILVCSGDFSNEWSKDIRVLKELKNLTRLDLSSNQITDISPIKDLKNLTRLKLSSNQITDINQIKDLKNLTWLHLNSNNITDLSPLNDLINLTHLELSSNQITDLSPLKDLINLTHLKLSSNKIRDVSPLNDLINLTRLDLRLNQIKDINQLKKLINLTRLSFTYNQIKDISPVKELKNLTQLYLGSNQIRDISSLKELKNLTQLYLFNNQIRDISQLRELKNLTKLNFSSNLIPNLPYEITNQPNCTKDFKNWFADLENGKAINQELKLIIIGNGRVGKSCIIDQLLEKGYTKGKSSTHAIQIERWEQNIQLEDKETGIVINVWDFGGQDIYHATHRYFMQSRALFLLVWDAETEDSPFTFAEEESAAEEDSYKNYPLAHWVDYIRTLSKHSPVIVVQNKIDKHDVHLDIHEELKSMYDKIYKFRRVSAETGEGIPGLKATILNAYQEEMPELGMEMPLQWFKVRKAVIELAKTHKDIPYERFMALCEEEKVRAISRSSLLGYLHNTGVLFYQEKLFDNKIILDQKWAISAVYTLFDRNESYYDYLRRGNGVFSLQELSKNIWKTYTLDECKVFLSFMESCEICFEYKEDKGNPVYIAPALVSKEKPYPVSSSFKAQKTKALHLIYHYKFFQEAFIHRFIVRAKGLLEQDEIWKNGLAFQYQDTDALIEIKTVADCIGLPEKERHKEAICIQVYGQQKEIILERIKNEFANIHDDAFAPTEYYSLNGEDFLQKEELEKNVKVGNPKVLAAKGNNGLVVDDFLVFLGKEDKKSRMDMHKQDKKPGISELVKVRKEGGKEDKKLKVFISYSHRDEVYKDKCNTALASLKRLGKIMAWDDRQIIAGADWNKAIFDSLSEAHIILLLISADFIASNFCYDTELKLALNKHATGQAVVIPIIVRSCDWKDLPFQKIQLLPRNAKPVSLWGDEDEAWTNVVSSIRGVVERFTHKSQNEG